MPSEDVIFGPRFPTWACSSCPKATNWASRVVCSCGKRCPDKIRAAATRNAYDSASDEAGKGKGKGKGKGGAAHPKGRPPVGGKAAGGSTKGGDLPSWSDMHTLAEQIKKLELDRKPDKPHRTLVTEHGSAEGELEEESAESLRLQIVELEGTAKSSSNEFIRKLAKEQVEELKAKLLDKKTPEDRQSAALWKLKKAKQKRTRILEQLLESKEHILSVQQAHLELEARSKAVDAKAVSLELLLAEASAASLPALPIPADIVISDDVLALAEHGAEIKELLASPAYASLLKLRAIAKKEVEATAVPHVPGTAASSDGSLDVVFKDSPADSWYDFGGDPVFFTEESYNQFKATSTRKEFTEMAQQMGFGCKKSRISKAEPY